jgi:ubiquinone/menaquinone biosynthesis C-methylase UbiE
LENQKATAEKPETTSFTPEFAASWAKWLPLLEKGAAELDQAMLSLARLHPGAQVLDVATGVGDPALAAARAVLPDGRVLASDLSPDMLRYGRKRAKAAGLTNLDFVEMDADRLDLSESAFDAVLSRWGLMFAKDLPSCLEVLYRSLKPGGRIVAAAWEEPQAVPVIEMGARVLRRELGLPPPLWGAGTPFALSDMGAFAEMLANAGFRGIERRRISVVYEFERAADYVEFRRERLPPALMEALGKLGETEQAQLWQVLETEVGRLASADGKLRLVNAAYCLAGGKAP